MENINVLVERPYFFLLLIPAAIVLLILYLTMKKDVRKRGKTIASLILHGVISFVLVLLAAGFSLVSRTDRQSTVILYDFSESAQGAQEEMAENCEALLSAFDAENLKGVVAFGNHTVYFAKKSFDGGSVKPEKVDQAGTDIASAMNYAVSLMDKYTHKRIILLSDGKETSGDAEYAAKRLAEEGVRIDTMYFGIDEIVGEEVQISQMTSQGGGYEGDTVKLLVTVEGNVGCDATLSVYEGDSLLESRDIQLSAGESTLEFECVAEESGMHCYRAVLVCEHDTEERNNEAFSALRTYGDTSVLIVASDPEDAEALKQVLSISSEVTVVKQTEAPCDLPTLCHYDSIYIMNADAEKLPEGFGDAVDTAAKVYGKNVCYVGGDSTFSEGHMKGTVYESMLPLEFGADDGKDTLLIIVMDTSGSMVGADINLLELAKIGAIKSLDSLDTNDYVSVISFSGTAIVEVYPTLLTAENKKQVAADISAIGVGGGTEYVPALRKVSSVVDDAVKNQMSFDQTHVIFLSDGSPNEATSFILRYVDALSDKGITVSTIGLGGRSLFGPMAEYGGVLEQMAERGDGRYNYVYNAMDLPDIMLEESESVSSQYAFEESFVPVVAHLDELTEDMGEMTAMQGYVGMRAKEDAVVYLNSGRGDPIYASWEYGEGTVSCFTTDLSGEWCGTWLASDTGKTFVADAMEHALPEVRYASSIIPDVTVDGGHVTLKATLPEGNSECDVIAEITGPETQKVQLERISATGYEASVKLTQTGEYEVSFTQKSRGKTVDEAYTVFAVSYSGEYDMFRESGSDLLATISAVSGGSFTQDPAELAAVDYDIRISFISQELPLCIIAAVLLLADIILRRFTRAELKKLFRRKKDA